jgi:tRNA (guanine-N7-)-methyltransferase
MRTKVWLAAAWVHGLHWAQGLGLGLLAGPARVARYRSLCTAALSLSSSSAVLTASLTPYSLLQSGRCLSSRATTPATNGVTGSYHRQFSSSSGDKQMENDDNDDGYESDDEETDPNADSSRRLNQVNVRGKLMDALPGGFGRIRQHVNPLKSFFQKPITLSDDWMQQSYKNVKLPFLIDLGCAKGIWIAKMAEAQTDFNFLGLEIRDRLVEYALKQFSDLPNAHYIYCNVNVNLDRLLSDINAHSKLDYIVLQFPDPLFKKKQKKRKILTDAVMSVLASHSHAGTQFFVQSDVPEVMDEIFETIDANGKFVDAPGYHRSQLWSNSSPVQFMSEREQHSLVRQLMR